MSLEDYDFLMKLILIGDSAVGKSNILSKYLKNYFDPDSIVQKVLNLARKI